MDNDDAMEEAEENSNGLGHMVEAWLGRQDKASHKCPKYVFRIEDLHVPRD